MEEENRRILEFCKTQQEREEQRMQLNKEMEEKKAVVQSKVKYCLWEGPSECMCHVITYI